ncbi:MAG TPA: hypothetical protein VEY91_10400 [Candidatus Limnocylindria bacterium]|nr:hypothetical protein [Candidatus Limnocylindria bacterium]
MSRSSRRSAPAKGRRGAPPAASSAKPTKGPKPPKPRDTLPDWAVLGLILAAALLLHARAVGVPFFADDYLFLDQARNHSLGDVLTQRDPIGNFFRPVSRQLFFWVLARSTQESPYVFHGVNVALFLTSLWLLFILARRLAGPVAAAAATAFLALHYAADVPIRWASGSQDLLALTFGLATLVLHLAGQRILAALTLLLALLSKETVALLPLVAVMADRLEQGSWKAALRRGWPLGVAAAFWFALWLSTAHLRAAPGSTLTLDPLGPLAALWHLIQVTIGLEWTKGQLAKNFGVMPPWLALIPALAALWWARERMRDGTRPKSVRPLIVGAAVALAGTIPVAAVIAFWSAYFYLFALCGVALVIGWLATRVPRWASIGLIAVLAWGSEGGRTLQEFATANGMWTTQSHVNRFYFERATTRVSRYLADMKRQRPTLPKRSTLFFAGLPSFVAWQAADGPLVRWAYRDSSLRSHYLGALTLERARRGPRLFFIVRNDTLQETPDPREALRITSLAMILSENYGPAHDALVLHQEFEPNAHWASYWLGWIAWTRGDTVEAKEHLREAQVELRRGPSPEIPRALAMLAVQDTVNAFNLMINAVSRYALDPQAHGLLADIGVKQIPNRATAQIEAFAARALAPDDPMAWYRWALIETQAHRILEGVRALERYFALGGTDIQRDFYARQLLEQLRRASPGGDLAQEGLRKAGVGGKR